MNIQPNTYLKTVTWRPSRKPRRRTQEDTAHNEGATTAAMEGLDDALAHAEIDTMSCHLGMLDDT